MTGWQIALIVVATIGVIILFKAIWFVKTHNKLKRAIIKIEESEASIHIALTKRFDTLTKMLDVTKGYISHEEKVLSEIVKLRQPTKHASPKKVSEFASQLSDGYERINLLAEAYPQLKADGPFMKLQAAAFEVEENLQAARRFYNSNVSYFNQQIAIWPNSIVAKIAKYEPYEFIEIDEVKKADIKLEFSK